MRAGRIRPMRQRRNAGDATIRVAIIDKWLVPGRQFCAGHRSVGGLRVSMYNALPLESVEAIADLMQEFAKKKG